MSFFDNDGLPIHEMSYCIFLDVLGFTQHVAASENSNELLQSYYAAAVTAINNLRWVDQFPGVNIKVFTDNIVIGIPWLDIAGDGETELGAAMMVLPYYQLEMALAGFFVRGGFSVGPLFMDENIVYGEALIEAYNLESSVAVVPRIVLSETVAGVIHEHVEYYYPPSDSPQNRQILLDTDNCMYVNYLDGTLREDGSPRWDQLETHRNNVTSATDAARDNTHVWLKYHWLCNYHNYFCRNLESYEGYADAILIPEETYQRLPTTIVGEEID